MAVRLYSFDGEEKDWEVVGYIEDGEYVGEDRYAESLDRLDIDLTDEEAIVDEFDNQYFNAVKVDE